MELPEGKETHTRRVFGRVDVALLWPKEDESRPWKYLGSEEDAEHPGIYLHAWARELKTLTGS